MTKHLIVVGIGIILLATGFSGCIGNDYSIPSRQWHFESTSHYTGPTEDIFIVPPDAQLKLAVFKVNGSYDSCIDVYMGSVLVRSIYSTSDLVLDYPGYVVGGRLIINSGVWRVSYYTRMV